MTEYEDRYPDAYGRGEEPDPQPRRRRFFNLGITRQVKDREPPTDEQAANETRGDAKPAAPTTPPTASACDAGSAPRTQRPPPRRHTERPRRPLVERSPDEICDDVAEQLTASPFIDASGIEITVDGVEVTLSGTINSLIAVSLAQALASNVPGVRRVQVNLRVQQAPHRYETPSSS